MEPGISQDVVRGVGRALHELGFAPPPAPAGGFIDGSVADALLDAAARKLKDDALGIHLAQRLPIGALGPLDYALCTSASLKEALVRVAKFYGLVSQRVKVALVEDGDRAHLQFTRLEGVRHSRHWIELSFAVFAERIRQTVSGRARLLAVGFVHAAPKRRAAHDAFFGVKVAFDAPSDVLTLPAKLLGLPLTTAAESLSLVLEARMRELSPAADPLLDRVRRAVVELLDKRLTGLVPTAAALKRSPRTLQRELQQRGTSHQQMLDEVRRERARTLLAQPSSQLTDVSWQLGFSEPSAFFRAYRRWTGTTPRAAGSAVGGGR